jgi:microcystin degradation protein MlrC
VAGLAQAHDAGIAQAGGTGDRILLLKIQCGMRRKKMHDMWDPLTSTLCDMWDPLTVLKLPSIPYFVPPT